MIILKYKKPNNKIYLYFLFKEVDIALGPFAIELKRHEVIEFSGYVGGAGSSILVRYPASIYISSYATVEPFNYQVVFSLNL